MLVYALFFAGQSPSYSQEVTAVHPVSYGYVSGASLADFGSVQLDHYKGDRYSATGFLGTYPIDIKEETGNPIAVNYYQSIL